MVPVIQLKKTATFSEIQFSERFIKNNRIGSITYNDEEKSHPFKVTFALKNANGYFMTLAQIWHKPIEIAHIFVRF